MMFVEGQAYKLIFADVYGARRRLRVTCGAL